MSTEDPKVNDCNSNTEVNKVGEFEMWPKKYKISTLPENPTKTAKRLKPNAIPSILGDVGLIKVVKEFCVRVPEVPFLST